MGRRRGEPTGACKVCQHPDRSRIELLLAGGAGFSAVGRKFGFARPDCLIRHWRRHVSEERKVALRLGPVQSTALAARVAEESESVLDQHRAVRAGLWQAYAAAVEAGDALNVASLAGRLTDSINATARITGEIASSPLVQNNTTINNLVLMPEFARFQADLIRALARFPDAARAVAAEFARIDGARARPALEHAA